MFKKKHPWYRRRGYLHFDTPVGFRSARNVAASPRQVARHSFYPFIEFIAKSAKIKRDPKTSKLVKSTKLRPIAYASHMDSHIYSYYATLLGQRFEQAVVSNGLQDCVLAFRALGKSNIEFAADAFEEIKRREASHVICVDIEGFFDNLDHEKLKRAWASLLGELQLPTDHFAVFKSITRHSKVRLAELYSHLRISLHNPRRGRERLCIPSDFRIKVREAGLIVTNPEPRGIPQGSPISALLSNIYMFDFDVRINSFVCQFGGCYFRYCDDMLFIVPPGAKDDVMALISSEIAKLGLRFQEKKTERRDFVTTGGQLTTEKPLQYLGFLFDGERILLRSAALARYADRMRRGVQLAKATMAKRNFSRLQRGEGPRPLFKKLLHKRYSDVGRRNFLSYGYKASKVMESNGIKKQLRALVKRYHAELAK